MSTESPGEQDMSMDIRAMLAAIWARKVRIVLVTVLLLAAAYGILMFIPKSYESGAAILVEPRDTSYTRATNEVPTSTGSTDDIVVSSQIELIKSRDTLMKVVDSENLRSVAEFNGSGSSPLGMIFKLFGRPASDKSVDEVVLNNLESHLTVIRQRDSRIISILVNSTDPVLAAKLANAIAAAHVQRRGDLSLSDTAEASVWLEQEIEKLRTSVSDAEKKVANFRIDNDLLGTTNNNTLIDQQLSAIAQQITSAQERENTAASRAALINGLIAAGQPIEGVPSVRESVVIQQLSEEKARLQGERAQRLATLLANHPTVKALAAQIAEIENQIKAEGQRVASALEAEAKIEGDIRAKLQADLAMLKGSASTATTDTVTLAGLEREAKAQRDLLENYLLRYRDATSRTDSNSALPDVRVITEATPSVVPSSPKTTLILIAVGIVALVLQIGSILFGELLSGRALVDRRPQRGYQAVEPVMEQAVAEAPAAVVVAPVPVFVAEAEPVEVVAEEIAPVAEDEPEFDLAPPMAEESRYDEPADDNPDIAYIDDVEDYREAPRPVPASVYDVADEITRLAAEPLADDVVRDAPPAIAGRPYDQDTFEIAPVAATEFEPVAEENVAEPRPYDVLAALSAEIGLGHVRMVMVAGLNSHQDCVPVAETLVSDALQLGLSVVRIDAGSGRMSMEPGLSDLSAEQASFGDVVHRSAREGLAEVPWGHLNAIDHRSVRPMTLLEAVADIYEVVIVMTGRIGVASTLPMFAAAECPVVLAGPHATDFATLEQAVTDTAALGYGPVHVVELARKAAVA